MALHASRRRGGRFEPWMELLRAYGEVLTGRSNPARAQGEW
ncbi:hypothetical protein [Arthrobacter sp.]